MLSLDHIDTSLLLETHNQHSRGNRRARSSYASWALHLPSRLKLPSEAHPHLGGQRFIPYGASDSGGDM